MTREAKAALLAALGAIVAVLLYARRKASPELAAPAEGAAPEGAPADEAGPGQLVDELDPQPKERVLQLGVASDAITFALAERVKGGKVEVLDAEQETVDALADRARDRGLRSVSGWHGDPHALLFEDNRFDRAVLFGADDEAVRRELERVVKPGGRVVVAEPGGRYVAAFAVPEA